MFSYFCGYWVTWEVWKPLTLLHVFEEKCCPGGKGRSFACFSKEYLSLLRFRYIVEITLNSCLTITSKRLQGCSRQCVWGTFDEKCTDLCCGCSVADTRSFIVVSWDLNQLPFPLSWVSALVGTVLRWMFFLARALLTSHPPPHQASVREPAAAWSLSCSASVSRPHILPPVPSAGAHYLASVSSWTPWALSPKLMCFLKPLTLFRITMKSMEVGLPIWPFRLFCLHNGIRVRLFSLLFLHFNYEWNIIKD